MREDHGERDEEVNGGKREGEEVCEGSERALKGGRRCVDRYRPRVGSDDQGGLLWLKWSRYLYQDIIW
jgi:hypothetical protein